MFGVLSEHRLVKDVERLGGYVEFLPRPWPFAPREHVVNLSFCDVVDDDIFQLRLGELGSTGALMLRGTQVRGEFLKGASLPWLRILDVGETLFCDSYAAELRNLDRLTHLFVDGTLITDAGMAVLPSLKSLEMVALDRLAGRITLCEVRKLVEMPSMRWICVPESIVPSSDALRLSSANDLLTITLVD